MEELYIGVIQYGKLQQNLSESILVNQAFDDKYENVLAFENLEIKRFKGNQFFTFSLLCMMNLIRCTVNQMLIHRQVVFTSTHSDYMLHVVDVLVAINLLAIVIDAGESNLGSCEYIVGL